MYGRWLGLTKPLYAIICSVLPVNEPGMPKTSPLQFVQQVRNEVSKIIWTGRRDLLVTTAWVFLMATLASIFFFLIDQVIRLGLAGLLGLF